MALAIQLMDPQKPNIQTILVFGHMLFGLTLYATNKRLSGRNFNLDMVLIFFALFVGRLAHKVIFKIGTL